MGACLPGALAPPRQLPLDQPRSDAAGAARGSHDLACVVLHKPPDCASFGLAVMLDEQRRVKVVGVDEGSPMAEWNAEHPDIRVEPGDRLLSVNGGLAKDALLLWTLVNRERHTFVHLLVSREVQAQKPDVGELLAPFVAEPWPGTGHETCPICLEELCAQPLTVQLPCGHWLHHDCAKSMLECRRSHRGARCPMCRQGIAFPQESLP